MSRKINKINKKAVDRITDKIKFEVALSKHKQDIEDDKPPLPAPFDLPPRYTFYARPRQSVFFSSYPIRSNRVEDSDACLNKLLEIVRDINFSTEYLRNGSVILTSEPINPVNYGGILLGIDIRADRDIIHYLVDYYLDTYGAVRSNNRFRKEKYDALSVWQERKLRKPFKQIAKELGIKESAAKMRFCKAYELLYGKKYDPADYEKPEIKKKYLKKECNTCKEKPTCKTLCPDVIAFVAEGTSYQREYIVSTPIDTKTPKDILIEAEENQDT